MLLRAGLGWTLFHLQKPSLFFFFKAVTFVLEQQDRFLTEWRLRGAHGCYSHEGWKVRGSEPDRGQGTQTPRQQEA